MEVTLYSFCTGINNKTDPARISFDPKTGLTDLESGINILIDKSSGIVSMRGIQNVASGSFQSSFPINESSFYIVKDMGKTSGLGIATVLADGTLDINWLYSGFTLGARFEFCLVDGLFYYMNGFQMGVMDGAINNPWPVNEFPREDDTAQFIPTPVGEHFDMLSSRFIITKGKELLYTEPGFWGIVDNNRNWRAFESELTMICSVGTGAFVSDHQFVYFLEGKDPTKWEPKKVLNYPANGKYHKLINPEDFGFQISDPSALLSTDRGPVVGLPDGSCYNLIDKKVLMYKGCTFGSLMVVDETTIIQSGV